MIERPRVDIIIPRYRSRPLDAEDAINNMAVYAQQHGVDVRIPAVRGNALIHWARNKALSRIRADATHVLFCDDDMAPEPDALNRLLERDVPVVSGLCTTREIPPKLVPKAYDPGLDRFVTIDSIRPGAFLSGRFGVGCAFLLLEVQVIERMKEYHLSGQDWLEDNRRLFDRLHVRTEYRERERSRIENARREHYKGGLIRVFQFTVQDNQLERGEDIHMSRMLIGMGIPIAIDASVQVAHIGDFPYGVDFLGLNDAKELRMTA